MNRFYQLLCLTAFFMVSSSGFTDTSEVAQSNQRMKNGTDSCCPKPKQDCCPKPKPDCCPKQSTQDCCTPKECCPPRVCEKMFEQGLELPCGKYPCAYNAPAGISLRCAWDFFVTGSFIYWHVSQDGMDTAFVRPVSATPASGLSQSGAVAYQNFKYKPGFKVGLGMNLDHDNWVLRAQYTWLHQSVSGSTGSLPTGATFWALNDWFSDTALFEAEASSVSSFWRSNFDMVDVFMERTFYQGTYLTVNPYGGMRALWLRQKFNVTGSTTAGTVGTSNNASRCWALGPTTGVGGHWLLGEGFRFEGNAGASILYTRYTKISNTQSTPTTVAVSSSTKNFSCLRPVGELAVGLGWGAYTCNNEYYFDIALDYEFLYFWDQNVMRMFSSNLDGRLDDISAFQMHGLTVTLRFDF